MMSQNKLHDIQRHRVNIIFKHYPILKAACILATELRSIFNCKLSATKAFKQRNQWYGKVSTLDYSTFRFVIKSFRNHAPTIINYLQKLADQCLRRGFNSKDKIFRAQMCGVRGLDFSIFRLVKLYA